MKKIRLSESELIKLVQRIVEESSDSKKDIFSYLEKHLEEKKEGDVIYYLMNKKDKVAVIKVRTFEEDRPICSVERNFFGSLLRKFNLEDYEVKKIIRNWLSKKGYDCDSSKNYFKLVSSIHTEH
jgi:DNA-binding GntR family transcriptional regulator